MKNLSPLNKRRLSNFVKNKRGLYSFWIFFVLFLISLFADFIANEKPLLIKFYNPIQRQRLGETLKLKLITGIHL
jgi:microcin C transport system permease protein